MSGVAIFWLFVCPLLFVVFLLVVAFGSGFPASLVALVVTIVTACLLPMSSEFMFLEIGLLLAPFFVGCVAGFVAAAMFGIPQQWIESELVLVVALGWLTGHVARFILEFFL